MENQKDLFSSCCEARVHNEVCLDCGEHCGEVEVEEEVEVCDHHNIRDAYLKNSTGTIHVKYCVDCKKTVERNGKTV